MNASTSFSEARKRSWILAVHPRKYSLLHMIVNRSPHRPLPLWLRVRRSCPSWPHLLLGLSAGWLIFAAQPAWGGPSDIAVRMRCPVLSGVSAAEFEARAKVDLSARSTRGGELDVVCDDLSARIRWRERGGAWFARSMPPTSTPATLVDALLVASKELVEEASRFDKAASGAAGEGPKGAVDATTPSALDLADPAEIERAPGEPGDASRTGKRPRDRATPPEETVSSSDRPLAEPAAPAAWAFGVSAGTQAGLFSLRGTGIVGPSVGVFVELPAGFVTSLVGEYDVAIGAGDVVSVRVASLAAVIAARFGPARAFEVGVGGLAGSVFVSSDAPYQPTSLAQGFWGAIVRGRYALRKDAWRFAFGPDARFHGFQPEIAVEHATVWGVPAVSVGLALEVSRELFGSR